VRTSLAPEDQGALLDLALAAVRSGIEREPIRGLRTPASDALNAPGASFVTLERDSRLLGCIGTIEPVRPLFEDVMQNAYRSAFQDPRLPAVTADDYAVMHVKVSVLGGLEPLAVTSREDLLAVLRPGVDGLLLVAGPHRATFLPAVWEKVGDADEFVDLLLRKGGLPADEWPAGAEVSRYGTEEFCDAGPRASLTR
jgi:AmmeMemoRadiSam system protein A